MPLRPKQNFVWLETHRNENRLHMTRWIKLATLLLPLSVAQIEAEDSKTESNKMQADAAIDKAFKLSASTNQWLQALGQPPIGFSQQPRGVRLLYGVTPEYNDSPYAILALVEPRQVSFLVLAEEELKSSSTPIDRNQWNRIQKLLNSENVWKNANFEEVMMSKMKSQSLWLVEEKDQSNLRLSILEGLHLNPRILDQAPNRKATNLLFAQVLEMAPEGFIDSDTLDWFRKVVEEYEPKGFERFPEVDNLPKNQSPPQQN